MRILIVSQYFWPEVFRINEIAFSLKDNQCDVEVLTGQPNYPHINFFKGYKVWRVNKEIFNNLVINRIPIFPRKKTVISLALNYLSFVISGILISPFLLLSKKYDVIFVYAPSPIFQVIPASFLGWLKGIPVVLWVQDLWPQSAEATGYIKSPWLLKMLEKFVRFSYAHTDLILVQSKAFIDPVSKLAPKIPVLYYPNSVEKDFYSPKVLDIPTIDSLKSGFTVLFAGNVGEAQSMETIVLAAKELMPYKEIKIVIIGSGSKIEWISEEIERQSLHNLFLEGRYPVQSMPALMRNASVLLASLTDKPIFGLTVPNKLQAYLAVGRPVIASLNGEGARIINDAKAGLSVPAEDAKGLAEAILTMYRMTDEERLKLGENGRKYFKENFDEDALIDELIKHFESVIKKENN